MKPTVRVWNLLVVLTLLFGVIFAAPGVKNVQAVSPDVVISQVYGGGGNSGGIYTNDFVELFNRGTATVSLAGWSIQYTSAAGTGNFGSSTTLITPLSGSIAPGQYILVQEAAGAAVIAPLPTPDVTDSSAINMSGTGGKVALVNTTTPLGCNGSSTPCTPAVLATIVDLVGWDGANFFEGAAAPATSNSTAILRNSNGCVDTDNNAADFAAGAPTPRNSSSPVNICPTGDLAPTVSSTFPIDGADDFPIGSNLSVNFSEPVNVAAGAFALSCTTSGLVDLTVSGGPASFTLDPVTDLLNGDSCTLTVAAAAVTDQDSNDPPDAMVADFTVGFTPYDVCVQPFTPIYTIQGSGPSVVLTGSQTTMGVVVGDYEGVSPNLRGFFIQDATGDGDPATSDGIFVFNGDRNNVALGEIVRVTGIASEFQGQSQISSSNIVACGTGSVEPTDVEFPVASSTFLEQYEGMLVRLPDVMYVTEHFQLGRFGQVVVSSDARLAQPTNVVLPGVDALALQEANNLKRIIIDDASQTQNPDPILFGRGGLPLSASNTLRGGDTITGAVGVMTYTWAGNSASGNAYRLRPVQALNGYWDFEPANPRPEAPGDVGGTLRVGALNLLNYFNTFDGLPDTTDNCTNGVGGAPTDCRGADTLAEFDRQWPKTVQAILKMNVDVLGIIEIENDGYGPESAIADLVNRLNIATAPGTYAFIDADAATEQINALGTDAIKVGFLYKPAMVTPVGLTAVLNSEAFVNGGDSAARNRPALAQAFQQNSSGSRFIAVINHLKSKGTACDAPDAGDGQGNCNQVRVNAALELANWLGTDPTLTGETDIVILGDLNSYAMEDPVGVFEDFGYTNLMSTFLGPDAYGYVFDGQWGYLDHALASPSLFPQVTGIAEYHINADEPSVLDYNTDFKTANLQNVLYAPDEFRVSDHDPVIVGLDLMNAPYPSDLGFATGGGWVKAGTGTYFNNPSWTGKAQFQFDVKYLKQNVVPQGTFYLLLEGTGFEFTSNTIEWLTISGDGTAAIFTGSGLGSGDYDGVLLRYIVWLKDGKRDDIRIQIWDGTQLVFDNGYLQRLSGNVQIHP